MSAPRCERRDCGMLLDIGTDGFGSLVAVCAGCARNARGRCRDCPAALASPRALRCPACASTWRKRRQQARDRARYADPVTRRAILAKQKAQRKTPERRAYIRAYQQRWAAADPEYTRWAQQKWRSTPAGRATHRKAKDRWNRKHRDRMREYSAAYYRRNRTRCLEQQRAYRQRKRAERAQQPGRAA